MELDKYSLTVNVSDGKVTSGSLASYNGATSITIGEDNTTISGNYLTVREGNYEATFRIENLISGYASKSCEVDLRGIGAMDIQIGANKGQKVSVNIPSEHYYQ